MVYTESHGLITSSAAGLRGTVKHKPLEVYFDKTSKSEEKKPADIPEDNNSAKHSGHQPGVNIERNASEKIESEISLELSKPLMTNAKETFKDHAEEAAGEKSSSVILEHPLDRWTVNVQGIKSPVLKKMLKELREQKEKV